jgi:hypothetical protein
MPDPKIITEALATLNEADLAKALIPHLAGTPVRGSAAGTPKLVVWTDAGDELALHLDATRALVRDGMLFIALVVDSDQTGPSTVTLPFAIGNAKSQLGLVATTESAPRGDDRIVGRWGAIIQRAVWRAVLDVAVERAKTDPNAALALSATNEALVIRARRVAT